MKISRTYSVPKMHCASCVMLLEGIEDDLPGVERAEASLKKNQLKVTFDDTVISEKNILAAVREEGYDAHPIGGSNG